MFDTETLRPVIIAMTLYLAISQFIPKKPTGIKVIDDISTLLEQQKAYRTSEIVFIGALVYLTLYIDQELL